MKKLLVALFMVSALFLVIGNSCRDHKSGAQKQKQERKEGREREESKSLDTKSFSAGNLYCFSMGLSKCNTPDAEDITSAQYDAIDFKKALTKQGYRGSVIVNEHATRENILMYLRNVVSATKSPNDRIVLFFATHGSDNGCLLTYGGEFVKYSEIIDILSRSKTKHIYVFVMACFSGSITKGLASDPNWGDNAVKSGITFITSSRKEEASRSLPNSKEAPTRYTFYGQALIKAFRGQADRNGDKYITIKELFNYVSNEVKMRSNGEQHPQLIGPSSEHNTIIARW